MDEARAALARAEANKYRTEAYAVILICLGVYGIALGFMAFFRAPIEWILVVGFVFGTMIICQCIVDGIGRLDAGRVYIEQACSDLLDTIT
jgi:hypothetical protein